MRAREFIAAQIAAALPLLAIKEPAEKLGEPDAAFVGIVQIVRTLIEPGPEQGFWLESLDVWVVTHKIDPRPAEPGDAPLETDLDDLVDDVIDALKASGGVRFIRATREMHPDGPHAYRVQVTAKTT